MYLATGGAPHRRPRLDWQNRTGRIANYSRDGFHAYVVWNGNHSLDRVSVALIEPHLPQVFPAFTLNQGVDQGGAPSFGLPPSQSVF